MPHGVRGGFPRETNLQLPHVGCLKPLRTLGDFEFHRVALIQDLEPIPLDGTEVDENVFTLLPLDESKPFGSVEPLDRAVFL